MSETQSSVAVVPVSAPSSHPAPSEGRVDLVAAERAARDLLTALGADLGREGLARTPARVARAYAEMLERPLLEATTFPNEEAYDELVVLSSVPFHSLCEHHLLPFHKVAHLGYLAGERILGLSKLARALAFFARDLQVQERLTMQVADCLEEWQRPRGVGLVVEAEHLCMTARGVGKAGTRTVTSALRGKVRDDPRTRQEFLDLTRRG
jgi:GTP cyclohydrolase I